MFFLLSFMCCLCFLFLRNLVFISDYTPFTILLGGICDLRDLDWMCFSMFVG